MRKRAEQPKQGVEVIRLVKPKTAIPIHYDDYTTFQVRESRR